MRNFTSTLLLAIGLGLVGNMSQKAFAQSYTVNDGHFSISFNEGQLDNPADVEQGTRSIGAFSTLSTTFGVRVRFKPGNGSDAQVHLTVTKGYMDYLRTDVKNGILTITWDRERLRRDFKRKKFTIACLAEITAPVPSKVKCEAGSSVHFAEPVSLPSDFDVEASSGSSVLADVLSGDDIDLDLNSGSSFRAKAVHARSVDIDASSGSSIDVDGIVVTEKAEVKASSGSAVKAEFDRSPARVEAESSSGASLMLKGSVEGNVELGASSGAMLDASSLEAPSARAVASSSGSVHAPKVKSLSFRESSSGKVHWKGHPQVTKLP